MFREYTVTDEAVVAARRAGVEGDVRARVSRMARRSAPFAHPDGNKRFRRYVLRVEGQTVTNVALVEGETVTQ